jgi:hypothetical protein
MDHGLNALPAIVGHLGAARVAATNAVAERKAQETAVSARQHATPRSGPPFDVCEDAIGQSARGGIMKNAVVAATGQAIKYKYLRVILNHSVGRARGRPRRGANL